jgi:hypothetical protein
MGPTEATVIGKQPSDPRVPAIQGSDALSAHGTFLLNDALPLSATTEASIDSGGNGDGTGGHWPA